jgi:phosphoglycolate phosphatase-like HAD superfamily hydrolase
MYKPTIIFDFDGVIHSYKSGWQGATNIPDEPVEGIREAIEEVRNAGFKVVVVSTRCYDEGGIDAIKAWLDKHSIIVDDVTGEKPAAILTVDDRCICFDGDASTLLNKIRIFKPWNK